MSESTEMQERLSPAFYELYKDEILKRNDRLLTYLVWFGIAVSGAGAIARVFLQNMWLAAPFALGFAAFVVLMLLRQRLIEALNGNATLLIYIVQVPLWIMGILLGSVLDPDNPTVTFFLFVVVLPLFVVDRPRNVVVYSIFWVLAYVAVAFAVKPFAVFAKDLSYLAIFAAASLITTTLLLNERIDSVKLFVESERNARTDRITGLKNHYALSREEDRYVNRKLVVGLARIDDLSFFVDTFGHDVGDELMESWGQCIANNYGVARCYRYTAHEILMVLTEISPSAFENTAHTCQNEFINSTTKRHHIRPSCSFGYVYGVPADLDEFHLMISHADVRQSEAQRTDKTQIRGAAFDPNRIGPKELAYSLGSDLQSDSLDALTGLPNMKAFTIRARSILDTAAKDNAKVVIIYFDLEDFKVYNEEHGFLMGDDLLRDIANILKESFPGRLISRFSDDHFVVLCYYEEYKDCLTQALDEAFGLHGKADMPLRAGVYIFEDSSVSVGLACDRASAACHSTKARYDVFWRIYDDELRIAEERRRHVISNIDNAINNGWLRVYYQPIVDVSTGKVVECEALVRWIDPTYGFMPPIDFISELENAYLIHKVDLWVAEQACKDYRARIKAGLQPLPVSINLSRLDFILCDVEAELTRIVYTHAVPKDHLHVEVTESAIAEDFSQLLAVTNKLREHGFEIWLDDFGSDYSSLTTLKDFPCDVIKLDMMFLRNSDDNERALLIIEQIVQMAHRLGSRSLVEGVEEQRHLDYLASIGCDYAQGYLISKPEPMESLMERGLV